MRLRYLAFSLFLSLFTCIKGQTSQPPSLEAMRDTIAIAADSTINAQTGDARLAASYKLIALLKKTIKTPGSYSFSLSEIPGIIEIRQEEDEFRILSWQVQLDEESYRYFGVIQFNVDTGKFIPLIDYSDMYKRPDMVVVTPDRWMGMAYYGIKTVKSGKKTYYTLFGYDAYNSKTTRKYIDVMWWDKDTLKFGAPIFELPDMPTVPMRFMLEYGETAAGSMNYDLLEEKIIFDHLTQLGPESDQPGELVPDGTYEGFEWKKNKWVHVPQIEYQKLEDGQAPTPNVNKKVSDDLSPHKPRQ